MKVAPKVIFLFKDPNGIGPAIFSALQPNPSSPIQRTETSFELSLEKYGIKSCHASGELVHFIDDKGGYQVSVLLVQNYERPVVACAVNEILASLLVEETSIKLTVIVPLVVQASLVDWKMTSSSNEVDLYGTTLGPTTDFTEGMVAAIKKPPPSLQIHYEPLACLLQLVHVLQFPTVLLVGPIYSSHSEQGRKQDLELLYKMGEFLAGSVGLCFAKDGIGWSPIVMTKGCQEPWRDLYG